jgi:hypothetical protein
MLYVPELSLSLDADGSYLLQGVTGVPSAAYVAALARAGAPSGCAALPPGALAVVLPILLNAAASASGDRATVRHRLTGLKLEPGAVVQVYVTVNDAISGQCSIVVPVAAAAAEVAQGMTLAGAIPAAAEVVVAVVECLQIAVGATPHPEKAKDTDQKLRELGVEDDPQTRKHQKKVAEKMKSRGSSIDQDAVRSGPNVTIAQCGQSIFENQGTR